MKELDELRQLTQKLTGNGYLKDQTEEWEFALDAIPESIVVVNRDSQIKFINKALQDRLNVENKENIYGIPCGEVLGGNDYSSCASEEEGTVSGTRYITNLNGWFEYTKSPIYSNTGKLIGYIIFLRDVSELKREKEKAEKYLDVAGVMMLVLDKNKKVQLINQKGCEILEGTEEEIVGKDWFEHFIPEELMDDVLEVFNSNLGNTNAISDYRNAVMTLKGNRKIIEWRNTIILDDAGNPSVALCSGEDITDRVAAENKIIKQRDTLNSIFESAPIGIGVVTNKDRTIKFVNEHFLTMFGMEKEDIFGRSSRLLYPSHSEFSRVGKEKHALVSEFGKAAIEVKMQTKSGEILDIYLSATNIGEEDNLLFTTTDITPLKKITEELELSNERLKILAAVHNMDSKDEEGIIEYALEEGERITGSKIAYLHFVEANGSLEESDIHLELFRWSRNTISACEAKKARHYPLSSAGIWADPVRIKKPVIHNDYENCTEKKGLPEGHVPLTRHLSVPIIDGDKVVGVAGVGNKDLPYDDNDANQLYALMNSMWEIIKANRIESKLVASNERYNVLFNTMLDGFALHEMVYDEDGNPSDYRFLEVNPAFEKLTGFTAEEVIGKTVKEIMPETEDYWIDTYGKVATTGEYVSFDNYSSMLGRWFEVTAFCPAPGQFACIFQDQTNHFKSLQTIKENEIKFRTIFNNHPDPVCILDITNKKFVDANVKFLEYVDVPKEEILGKTSSELGLWYDESAREEFYRLLENKTQISNFKTKINTNRGVIDALVSCTVILIDDKPHLISLVKDISGI